MSHGLAGATTQKIILPPSDWDSAEYFVSNSAEAMSTITNPGGSYTNLIFDIHQYLDSGSRSSADCISTYILH
jgi:endoglucanase